MHPPVRSIARFSPSFGVDEARIVSSTLGSENDSERVEAFERAFAEATGTAHAVMVPSGRFGCFLALEALGIGAGDEVILPALTYFAVAAMVDLLGAVPVFADVGERTHVLDPASVESRITPRTRAIVATHLYGTPCDMDALGAIARRSHVRIIEDCCQAAGARHRDRTVGSIGAAGFYTFGLTKNMTSLVGGMIATHDRRIADHARDRMAATTFVPRRRLLEEALTGVAMALVTKPAIFSAVVPLVRLGVRLGTDPIESAFGEDERRYTELGSSFHAGRPRAVQAEVGLAQLERLPALNAARRRNAAALDAALAGVPGVDPPAYPPGAEPIAMSYVVEHDAREALARRLRARGIDTAIGFMSNLADHPLFPDSRSDCPNAVEAIRRMLHLPVHPALDEADVARIARVVREEATALA
jgi:perosamine synthetase